MKISELKKELIKHHQRDYDQELIKSTRPQHELHDSPWVWLAGPVLLLGVLALGYVRMIIGV